MATQSERIAILETKVDNLKETVEENNTGLKAELKKMYEASCTQHANLAKDLEELKSFRNSTMAKIATAIAIIGPALGWLVSHVDWTQILK